MIRAMNTSCLRFLSGLLTLSLLLSVLTHAPLHSHEQANAVEAPQAHHCHDHQDHAHSESPDSESNEESLELKMIIRSILSRFSSLFRTKF